MPKRAPGFCTRRYLFEHGPEVAVFVVIFAILAVVLLPRMVFTIPAGHVGVLWKRFGGTVLDHTISEGIGDHPGPGTGSTSTTCGCS